MDVHKEIWTYKSPSSTPVIISVFRHVWQTDKLSIPRTNTIHCLSIVASLKETHLQVQNDTQI